MGVIGMTKEHLGLALALNVPVFVVVTKIDMCPPNVLQETLKLLQRILRSPGCRKIPVLVQNTDDVVTCAMNFTSERFVITTACNYILVTKACFFKTMSDISSFKRDWSKLGFTESVFKFTLSKNGCVIR